MDVTVSKLKECVSKKVRLKGWLYNKREKGRLVFLLFRDGTGLVQIVAFKDNLSDDIFTACRKLTRESSIIVEGIVRKEPRAPGGVELDLTGVDIVHLNTEEFPIQIQDVVPDVSFLLENRHLWLRSRKQAALMRLRSRLIYNIRSFFDRHGYFCFDSPILTPSACEGTTTLFEVDYFGDKAFLSQSGQLYLEAACMSLGNVYCFGPVFRAEKSKTRKHLTEFWMVEGESAYMDFNGLIDFVQLFVDDIVRSTLRDSGYDLEVLERDIRALERVKKPFPVITYKEAVEAIRGQGVPIEFGDDFGASHEEALSKLYDQPLFITRYPAAIKPFYMQPDSSDETLSLAVDVIAPEGFGEIVGGSQRVHDYDVLKQKIEAHKLPLDAYKWYLELRKYGSVPHSGFGLGIERTLGWLAGVRHIRECIPFPRMLYKIYP